MSDYYNQYNVRDAYWKNVTGPLTLFAGRQIVTWGESLAFRVGDVINPQDFTWSFGFNNLRAVAVAVMDGASDPEPPELGTVGQQFC